MLDAALAALEVFMDPYILLLVVLASLFGMLMGALPGLGAGVTLSLLIPLTFGMETNMAFVILGSALGGVAFGGSVSAILINVPGASPNAATLLDGYPMAKKGEANVALGASATASALGALIGLVIFIAVIPVMRQILRLFGPPEFFALAIFGITILGVISKGSLVKGLIAGAIGLIISFVGFNAITGGSRYTFGSAYLTDGIGFIPVLIGIFAISEMLSLLERDRSIADTTIEKGGSVIDGVRATFVHWGIVIRSSITGIVVGLIPAAGGTVANFVAYLQAVQFAKDKDSFGTGDVRGVIASEASNDAKDGGAMIPTLSFGIPGSVAWAVLLGAFVLHGIRPGPQLLTEYLDLVFVIIIALVLSNIITSITGILLSEVLTQITMVPIGLLAPQIFVVSLLGAYAVRLQFLDVVLTVIIGILGYLLIKYEFSRIALILGVILGPIAENSFHQSLQIAQGSYMIFFTRPIALALLILAVLSIFSQVAQGRLLDSLIPATPGD